MTPSLRQCRTQGQADMFFSPELSAAIDGTSMAHPPQFRIVHSCHSHALTSHDHSPAFTSVRLNQLPNRITVAS